MDATRIVIIGGGAAGITVAASLMRRADGKALEIRIVDPAKKHFYQPALTLVGGGAYELADTNRPMQSVIPKGVEWIAQAVTDIDPENNQVKLADQTTLDYDYLVVCPGVSLDWDAIEGLSDTIGKNGVCTNYSPQHVEYTWECIQALKAGDKAFFTQAPLPFKCPGAPQKIAYMAADYLKQKKILDQCELHFTNPGPGMFGVPFFAKQLVQVAAGYGIECNLLHKLTKIDGERKVATFQVVGGDEEGTVKEFEFDMIHVTPHQKAPDFLKGSGIVNEAGYVEVDQNSMQQVKYPNVFGLGDACSTPNSKTAAAVRKQAPTVVANIKNMIDGKPLEESYLGYGACPLVTARGKVIMAEFIYGGKVTPTLPFFTKPHRESSLMWPIKTHGLPFLYWEFMLKGHEKFFQPDMNYDAEARG
jgi:sulfide:quinone oxidoreductase